MRLWIFWILLNPVYVMADPRMTITIPFEVMPPMKIDDNGNLGGVHKDLLDRVVKKLNVDSKFVVVPFARSLFGLKTGIYDLTNGKLKNAEREAFLHFVEPPFETKIHMVLFIRKGDNKKIPSYEALSGLNIATMNGRTYSPRFDSDQKLKKVAVTSVDQQLNMVVLRRVEAAIMSDIEGYYAADRLGIRDKIEVAEFGFITTASAYFAVSKKSKLMQRIGELEKIIADMAASGETDRIYQHYFTSRGLPVPNYK